LFRTAWEGGGLTAGQKAMAYAVLFPEAKHGGDRKSAKSSFPKKLVLRRSLRSATPNPKARGWMFLFYQAI
jgi:hypothetical protein